MEQAVLSQKTPLQQATNAALKKLNTDIKDFTKTNSEAEIGKKKNAFFLTMRKSMETILDETSNAITPQQLYREIQRKCHSDNIQRASIPPFETEVMEFLAEATENNSTWAKELQDAISQFADYTTPAPNYWKNPKKWASEGWQLYGQFEAIDTLKETIGTTPEQTAAFDNTLKDLKTQLKISSPFLAFILSMTRGLDKYPQPIRFIAKLLVWTTVYIPAALITGTLYISNSITDKIFQYLLQKPAGILINFLTNNKFTSFTEAELSHLKDSLNANMPTEDQCISSAWEKLQNQPDDPTKQKETYKEFKNRCAALLKKHHDLGEIVHQTIADVYAQLLVYALTSQQLEANIQNPTALSQALQEIEEEQNKVLQTALNALHRQNLLQEYDNIAAFLSLVGEYPQIAQIEKIKIKYQSQMEEELASTEQDPLFIFGHVISAIWKTLTQKDNDTSWGWFIFSWPFRAFLLGALSTITAAAQLTRFVLNQIFSIAYGIVILTGTTILFALNFPRLVFNTPKYLGKAWKNRAELASNFGNWLSEKAFTLSSGVLLSLAAVGVAAAVFGLNPVMLGIVAAVSGVLSLILTHDDLDVGNRGFKFGLSLMIFLGAAVMVFFAFGPILFPEIAEFIPSLPQLLDYLLPFAEPIQAAIAAAGAVAIVILPTLIAGTAGKVVEASTPSDVQDEPRQGGGLTLPGWKPGDSNPNLQHEGPGHASAYTPNPMGTGEEPTKQKRSNLGHTGQFPGTFDPSPAK